MSKTYYLRAKNWISTLSAEDIDAINHQIDIFRFKLDNAEGQSAEVIEDVERTLGILVAAKTSFSLVEDVQTSETPVSDTGTAKSDIAESIDPIAARADEISAGLDEFFKYNSTDTE